MSMVVRLYYWPQSFPCGPQSSCCGPVGQSREEIESYVRRIGSDLPGVTVETFDVSAKLRLERDRPVIKLVNTFGVAACPIFVANGEVVSMGPPAMAELMDLLRARLRPGGRAAAGQQDSMGA
jgi:hypothetical protein